MFLRRQHGNRTGSQAAAALVALRQPREPDAERHQAQEGWEEKMKRRVREAENEAADRDPAGSRRRSRARQ